MRKIDDSGIYDIPIEQYHGDCCDGPSISSSGLRTIMMECPALYYAYSPLNPRRLPAETTKALDLGRAAHALALGEPEFVKYFVISPYDDFRTKDARAWRDAEPRTVLKEHEYETVCAMALAQRHSPQCSRAFEDGKPEQSIIHRDPGTGIWLKTRPDWLPHKPAERFVTEYKTAVTIEPKKWSAAAFGYGYEMQAAMQFDAIEAVTGKAPIGIAHVVQEKSPPYLCELRMFSPDHIEDGRYLYRRALRIFAHCLKTGVWPGYTTDAQFVETPFWFQKLMENYRNGIDPTANYATADKQWEREWQRPIESAERGTAD